MIRTFTKDQLIEQIKEIIQRGWIKSVKEKPDKKNDGAVGNTLETLLGIKENNLPIPNATGWELKGQRSNTSSLVSLKHYDPFPRGTNLITELLLPMYGWPHQKAGTKYPVSEMSFRSTTSALNYTNRGFRIILDRPQQKLRFIFDSTKVDTSDPKINAWLASVNTRIGLGPLSPEPYWGFPDLQRVIGEKVRNSFYVIADSKVDKGVEYFKYVHLCLLSGYSFDKFLYCVENGIIFVDFDARTGHNHGVKFRIKQNNWSNLYSDVQQLI